MLLKIVYGRSGAGKSEYIYKDIKQKLDEGKKNIFVIVPEQSNLSAERKLLEITGRKSLIDAEVLTLSRMAYRVISETGDTNTHLSVSGKNMLIYDLLSAEKKNLNFLGKSEKNIDTVNRLFTELKKHNVSINDLKEAQINDKYTSLKINDVICLYEKYEEKLTGKFIDENDILNLLIENIDKTDLFKDSYIYIDEFLGFTAQEYGVLRKLFKRANEITVCVFSDSLKQNKPKEQDIFYFNKKFANKIIEIAKENGAEIKEIYLENVQRFKNEELKFLEKNFENNKRYETDVNHINLFLASNQYTELEYVAQKIYELTKHKNYKYNEIGIIVENIDSYSYDAKSIFSSYDIPLFVDEKKELNQNILIQFITAILDVFSNNWSYESVFNFLKCGLLEISNEDIYSLENYCLKWGVKGSKWYNKKFDYEPLNDKQENLEQLRQKIVSALLEFKNGVSGNKTAFEITNGIYTFLIKNDVLKKLDENLKTYDKFEVSSEYNTSYKILISIFDEICTIFGNDKMSFEKYKELFEVALNSSELGKIPATQDQVILGELERTRNNKIRCLFILGANDGAFPSVNKSEGFLNDNDREILQDSGIELAKTSIDMLYEQQFNIYRTLTTPEEELFILYCSSDKEGKSIRPSTLIKKMKRNFPKLKEESDIIEKNYEIIGEKATFEECLNVYRDFLEGKEISKDWEKVIRFFYQNKNEEFEKLISGLNYTNKAEKISEENIKKLYGNTLNTSVSRLENYRRCPFSFHLTYGLKLKERDELKIQTMDTGSFMHEVIDIFFKKIDEREINIKQIEDDKIKEIVEEIITEMLVSSKYYIFSSSAKYRLLTKRLKKVVFQAICYIVYTIKNSDFSVLGHEIEFSNTGKFKPIKMKVEEKNIEITGKIDRADIAKFADSEYIRIIDYKSSVKDLDLNLVKSGLQIQLITYLNAISEQSDIQPSGVLYMSLIDNIVKADRNLSEEEIEAKIRKNFRMKGLILADISVVKMMDNKLQTGASDIIPVYITANGEISQGKSSTISKSEFEDLSNEIKKIITEISLEIFKGNIDIKPYNYKKKTGCDYCKYKTICNFNTTQNNYFNV